MQIKLTQLETWLDQKLLIPDSIKDAFIINGISIDSRTVIKGNLFIALSGTQFDAHNFLAEVEAKGAVAVVVEKATCLRIPIFLVQNTRIALRKIASCWRKQFSIPIIAVTGSNGKTTVKEMIVAILKTAFGDDCYLATYCNFNNEIGVSLTVLGLRDKHRACVIELGISRPGETAILANIVQPTVALINNAQREHQEFLITVESVARESSTIFESLQINGVAIFPIDDKYVWIWRNQLRNIKMSCRVLNFGFAKNANVSARYFPTAFGNCITIVICINKMVQEFKLNLAAFGAHNVRNVLAAITCVLGLNNISTKDIIQGIETFIPIRGRLKSNIVAHGLLNIIDDTYNANPDSVRVAIDVLASITDVMRRILIIGDMAEIGTQAKKYHEEIGWYAYKRGIQYFFGFGIVMRYAVETFNNFCIRNDKYEYQGRFFDLIEDINAIAEDTIVPYTTVLVKGSRCMKMERIVQHLINKFL